MFLQLSQSLGWEESVVAENPADCFRGEERPGPGMIYPGALQEEEKVGVEKAENPDQVGSGLLHSWTHDVGGVLVDHQGGPVHERVGEDLVQVGETGGVVRRVPVQVGLPDFLVGHRLRGKRNGTRTPYWTRCNLLAQVIRPSPFEEIGVEKFREVFPAGRSSEGGNMFVKLTNLRSCQVPVIVGLAT